MRNKAFIIKSITVGTPCLLSVTFGDSRVMEIDLSPVISRYPVLSPLKDPAIFALAHVGEFGSGVVWTDDIDLAGDNLRAEATEQGGGISHERIWDWMYRNGLTLDAAAAALGISRRMVAYYRNGEKTIPKHIWLACLGWEVFMEQKMAA